jgi:hypothetical protein
MAHPNSYWLIHPTIPAAPALPRLDHETLALADGAELGCTEQNSSQHPSGTWRVGTRIEHELEDADPDSGRFATSDAEAPTIRPGVLRAWKLG